MAQRLAVEGETPKRSAQTRHVMPERRQRRIRWPLDSVTHRSHSSGNKSTSRQAVVVVVIIGLGETVYRWGSVLLNYNTESGSQSRPPDTNLTFSHNRVAQSLANLTLAAPMSTEGNDVVSRPSASLACLAGNAIS